MESEKVKDIKKALECCGKNNPDCDNCPYSVGGGSLCRQLEQEALTLINELESENEWLRKERDKYIVENKDIEESNTYANEFLEKYKEKNKNLKDRIAELEKENKSLYDSYHKGYKVGYEYGKQDAVSSERAESDSQTSETTQTDYKLEQFAERLKEKIQNCSGCYIPDCFESPTNEFAYSEIEVNKAIDETLKEFLK